MIELVGVGVAIALAAWTRFPYRLVAMAAMVSLAAAAIASLVHAQSIAVEAGNLALLCFVAAVVLVHRCIGGEADKEQASTAGVPWQRAKGR